MTVQPFTVILGAQWGDEGKGKMTDLLAEEAEIVVRFQGGANAGHTIINEYRSAVPTAKGKFSCKAILICISKIFKKLQVFKICSNGTVHNYKINNS